MGIVFSISPKRYKKNTFELVYSKILWDSEYLQNSTYEIFDIKGDLNDIYQGINDFENYIRVKKGDLVFVKIPSMKNELVQLYSKLGFYFIEQSVEPVLHLLMWKSRIKKNTQIKLMRATKNDIPKIANIAQTTFTTDRYHMDINIPSSLADYRYKKWVENSYNHNEEIFIFKSSEDIIGFFIIKFREKLADIRLNGLRPDQRGKGLGKEMYIEIISTLKDLGYEKVTSHISLNNLQVLNIYSSLRFKFGNSLVVLHKYYK